MNASLMVHRNVSKKGKWHHLNSKMSGFSIIEVILALGITAVMAGSVFMVYANAIRLETRSRELNEVTFRSYMIFKAIEDDIGRSVSYRFRAPDGNGEYPGFIGEKDRIVFAVQTQQGLRWVEYSLQDPSDEVIRKTTVGRRYYKNEDQVLDQTIIERKARSLVRQQSLLNSVSPDDSRKEGSEVVVNGLYPEDFSLMYGSPDKNAGIVWKDAWNDPVLPSAIRVDVRISRNPTEAVNGYTKVIVLPAGF